MGDLGTNNKMGTKKKDNKVDIGRQNNNKVGDLGKDNKVSTKRKDSKKVTNPTIGTCYTKA